MSNFLAIATVTEALRRLLQAAVDTAAVPGADATTVRPSGNGTSQGLPDTGVNAYLFQAPPNAAWRNADLPTRGVDGQLRQRPQAALDLHYLLTFYGNEAELEPQRLLGSVVRDLHAQPLLSREGLRQIVNDSTASDPTNPSPPHPYLADSDLAEQIETVRFSPVTLSLEELSKLWSIFFQTPYALSIAYQGTVVLIESEAAPRKALPVRKRRVLAIPFRRPLIKEVSPQIVEAGGTLTLRGQNLSGGVTFVVFDRVTEAAPLTLNDRELTAVVPATLRAGIHVVSVRHDVELRDDELDPNAPSELRQGFASSLVAFALAPVVITDLNTDAPVEVARGTTLTLELSPAIERRQDVSLILGDQVVPIQRDEETPTLSDSASFSVPEGLDAGSYLLRVQVDGVQSALEVDEVETTSDTFGQYVGPRVNIT
jgi:hypothetical protein